MKPTLRLAVAGLLCGGAVAGAAGPSDLPPLSAVSGSPRLPGKFVWADLVTDDVPAAGRFYAKLFDWTLSDYGGYIIASNDDRPMCGMFQRPRPKASNATPRWFGYISVNNVNAAERAVVKAGGRVLAESKKMSKRGEQAVFADPEGAVFGVVKSSAGDPQDFMAARGDWIWVQLLSRDARKAAEFYRVIAGYEIVENSQSNRVGDLVLTSKGYARGTVRTIPVANREKVQPTWLPFVRVKNVGETIALAKQLGGSVRIAPRPEVLEGKAAVIADPTGAVVGIMEWPEAAPKGGR